MKKRPLPTSEKRRKILYEKKNQRERFIELGDMFFGEARYVEAAEFYGKASHPEGIERIESIAREQGDCFLLESVMRGRSVVQDPKIWEDLGRKALELGKYSYAIRAFRKAGNTSLVEEAEHAFKGAVQSGKA